jgi:hypothetical protein
LLRALKCREIGAVEIFGDLHELGVDLITLQMVDINAGPAKPPCRLKPVPPRDEDENVIVRDVFNESWPSTHQDR